MIRRKNEPKINVSHTIGCKNPNTIKAKLPADTFFSLSFLIRNELMMFLPVNRAIARNSFVNMLLLNICTDSGSDILIELKHGTLISLFSYTINLVSNVINIVIGMWNWNLSCRNFGSHKKSAQSSAILCYANGFSFDFIPAADGN